MTTTICQANTAPTRPVATPATGRLISLDALRGFDMLWIVGLDQVLRGVATASGRPSLAWIPVQLEHLDWEGFHFYDLIFPLFLFMIGVSIPFALGKRIARGDTCTATRRLSECELRKACNN